MTIKKIALVTSRPAMPFGRVVHFTLPAWQAGARPDESVRTGAGRHLLFLCGSYGINHCKNKQTGNRQN